MTRAFVGLGSNLGDRRAILAAAVAAVDALADVAVLAESSIRETEPWGPVPQPDYLNQVVVVETGLTPPQLLDELLAIERTLGRERTGEVRYGPRTIDLDLLVFGTEVISDDRLDVPHPRIAERQFVLEPLAELDPDLVVPGRGVVTELLARLRASTPGRPLDDRGTTHLDSDP